MQNRISKMLWPVLACILLFSLSSKAQSADLKSSTPEQRAQHQSDAMKSKLGLDTVQYQKVYDINLEYGKKGQEIMEGGGGKFAKYRKFKSMMSEKDGKLKKVLTRDQYTSYEEMKKEMMDKAREKYQDGQ